MLWPPVGTAAVLAEVSVQPAFFNPSVGQQVEFRLSVEAPGSLSVTVVDRDGFAIRSFPPRDVAAGLFVGTWDGRDDAGSIVPDEAYFLRIALDGEGHKELYDPVAAVASSAALAPEVTYSRTTGTLSYTLEYHSRVHIQAGQARVNAVTHEAEGPVLKTVLDRQPRVGGRVIEQWNGMDESAQVYVPDLPDFGIGILVTPLPENPLITVGNRGQSFSAYALAHRSPAALAVRQLSPDSHSHHAGLTALEDGNPVLWLEPQNAEELSPGRWRANGSRDLRFRVHLDEKAAPYFLAQPTEVFVFLDAVRVARVADPGNPETLKVPLEDLAAGEHRVAVNWGSRFGPVGVAVAILEVQQAPGGATKGGGQ